MRSFNVLILLSASSLNLALAQDQCNLLPLSGHVDLPLHKLVPHSLTPTNQTLCEAYAPSNGTQLAWITKLINLAFTGDYVPLSDPWPADPNGTYQSTGILDPQAKYRDPCDTVTNINLVPYFNGTWRSNNRNGKAVAISFLDGGSVPALRDNVPAWNIKSNQYKMMVGFYQYFGYLLGCTDGSVPKYNGSSSQTSIHRFMDLPAPSIHYFIHNVYDAAVSLGVAGPDLVTHVGDAISIGIALDNVFNKRCSPPQQVIPYQGVEPQSICGDNSTCAVWTYANATCSPYMLAGYGLKPALAGVGEVGSEDCGVHRRRRAQVECQGG